MGYPPLYILRHGETEWNAAGRLQGRFDSPLTPLGQQQARQQRRILARCDLAGHVAFCSPQGRAAHTAEIALEGLIAPITPDARLTEIGLGDWAGAARAALIESEGVADGFDLYARAPGGEGFEALRARCTAFLNDLPGPAVVVTHGITSRMLRLILLGRQTEDLRDLPGGQGVVFHLRDKGQSRLTD